MATTLIRCSFWLRESGNGGGYRYTELEIESGPKPSLYPVPSPPAVGDHIALEGVGDVRVVGRQWDYEAYGDGAGNWRTGSPVPDETFLTVVVERSEGVFVQEEPEAT